MIRNHKKPTKNILSLVDTEQVTASSSAHGMAKRKSGESSPQGYKHTQSDKMKLYNDIVYRKWIYTKWYREIISERFQQWIEWIEWNSFISLFSVAEHLDEEHDVRRQQVGSPRSCLPHGQSLGTPDCAMTQRATHLTSFFHCLTTSHSRNSWISMFEKSIDSRQISTMEQVDWYHVLEMITYKMVT